MPAEAPIFAYPYDAEAEELAETSMEHLHDPSRRSRLQALTRLLRMPRFRNRVPSRSLLFPGKRRIK